jgi:hypothetical protein
MMEKKAIKISGRERLLAHFRNGKIPSEEHYNDLIESMVHKEDDGFSKDDENGLKIYSDEKYCTLVSFYKNSNAIDPFFIVAKDKASPDSLRMQPFNKSIPKNGADSTSIFFHTNGKLGVGKKCADQFKVDVDGFIGMSGRIGTYRSGKAAADGKWYPIVKDLQNGQAFEVMARTGKLGRNKCAIMHATALSVFGPRGGKIRKTNAHYGNFWKFWDRINLRWHKDPDSKSYSLQIKSYSNYGKDVDIYYTITRLWDDRLFLSKEYYSSESNNK